MALLLRILHSMYVVFVVVTPMYLLLRTMQRNPPGYWKKLWSLHLLIVCFVLLQYHFHWPCPLTIWENRLRGIPGQRAFLPNLPLWQVRLFLWLTVVYSVGSLVALTRHLFILNSK